MTVTYTTTDGEYYVSAESDHASGVTAVEVYKNDERVLMSETGLKLREGHLQALAESLINIHKLLEITAIQD